MTALGDVASLVGAAGIDSLLAQWLTGGRDRRGARADALSALRRTEQERSARPDRDASEFTRAAQELETSCLIAGIPRLAADHYVALASASLTTSTEHLDVTDSPSVETKLDDATRLAATILVRLAWSGGLTRLTLKRRLRKPGEQVRLLRDPERGYVQLSQRRQGLPEVDGSSG